MLTKEIKYIRTGKTIFNKATATNQSFESINKAKKESAKLQGGALGQGTVQLG